MGTDGANKLSLCRARGLTPSGSGEQGPKPTSGLMAVSLLWATLPCLTHMSRDPVRGWEETPGCAAMLTGSGTSKSALRGVAAIQGSPSFFLPLHLHNVLLVSSPLLCLDAQKVPFFLASLFPTRRKMPVAVTGQSQQVQWAG